METLSDKALVRTRTFVRQATPKQRNETVVEEPLFFNPPILKPAQQYVQYR